MTVTLTDGTKVTKVGRITFGRQQEETGPDLFCEDERGKTLLHLSQISEVHHITNDEVD